MVWVGQFGIVDGQASEQTPWVGIYPDEASDSDGAADLYLVVEPAIPGSEEFVGEMKDAIADIFHDSRYTLTGGILRALRSAHENLRDWNRRSLKEHRVAAGISCVAVRDEEAYLAQVGPAEAAYLHAGGLKQLQPSVPDAREALGLEEEFYPEFHHFELEPGDKLLIMSPAVAHSIESGELARMMAMKGEQALPELYGQARAIQNGGAVLIAAVPAAEE